MIKLLLCLSIFFSLHAKATPVHELTGLWVMHFKYTGTYKQRSRVMAIRFNDDGECTSGKNTKCVWFQIGKDLTISYFVNKDGEWQESNNYKAENISEKRISGSISRKESNSKVGDWLMVRSERETNLEALSFNSLWETWNLHYRLKSQTDWVIIPMQMKNDSGCLVDNTLQLCLWNQSVDLASFWLPVSGYGLAFFKTSAQPITYNPNGQIYSAISNEIIGTWFLSPR